MASKPKTEDLGDISVEEFRDNAHKVVDWIADYLAHPERYPVLSRNKPGDVLESLPSSAPERGESFEAMLEDLDRIIVPGVTHWNHPGFFAYFATSGSAPGILGEMLSAAFNVNAMLWRTSPAATELEQVTLNWLRELIGLPDAFEGVVYDTASIATLCAIAAAREAVEGLGVRERGLSGSERRLRLYASEQAHSSIDKAAITLGLGLESIRKIPTDSEFRMDPRELESAISSDRANGWLPFCVVATVGTTSIASIDPVPAIADVCKRESLWLHVDAAYGGAAAVSPELRWVLEGSEHGDSLVINPHKWLFVPFDFSALYSRRMDVLRRAFSLVPEYLRTSEPDEVKNFMDYGPQLGRRFRAIKFWFVMRYFGRDGLAARIREHVRLAKEFRSWVERDPNWEILAPTHFSLVCFRARLAGSDISGEDEGRLNEQLLEEVNRRGRIYLSHTKLRGKFALRLAIGNIRTAEEHVRLAWDELRAALERVTGRA